MRLNRLLLKILAIFAGSLVFTGCGSLPAVSTDVTYCCQSGFERIHNYRVEFEDMPEFLKPMLRDEIATVLGAKGLEYTEGDAHAVVQMTFVNRTLSADESARDEAWETIAPGGGVRFIAEVKLEMTDSVTGERLWAGTMGRVHNVYEGSYMHDAPARTAMRDAFRKIFADYPDSRLDPQ
jgi:hypothetical protein